MRRYATFRAAAVVGFVVLCLPAIAGAQAPKSQAVAKELTTLLEAKKLDAIAAKLSSDADSFAAALYFPGVQLLVVSGKYAVPVLLGPKLAQKEYKDLYMELSGTVPRATKVFVMDMGAPGLALKKADGRFDTWAQGDKQVSFDGDPDKQKISDDAYEKMFIAADEEYARILSALLDEAKK